MSEEILAYCVKEKTKKPMQDAVEITLSNGRHALRGVCSVCGTKMLKFASSKKIKSNGASADAAEPLPEERTAAPVAQG